MVDTVVPLQPCVTTVVELLPVLSDGNVPVVGPLEGRRPCLVLPRGSVSDYVPSPESLVVPNSSDYTCVHCRGKGQVRGLMDPL